MNHPLVSILCITYNHENFIRDAIEGFLMQDTTFPFEILIYDDASTDQTTTIIKDYLKKSDKITAIFQKENQWSKGRYGLNDYLFPQSKGKYIALCEGDDYWTDPLKLQKQVDFLEANPDFSICFHRVNILKNNHLIRDYITREVRDETDIIELAKGNYIHTPSVVFRVNSKKLPDWIIQCPAGDYAIHMFNAQYGKIKKFNEIMCKYRLKTAQDSG